MKTKLTVLPAVLFFVLTALNQTNAQQVNWRTAGNNVADGQHLGSNNDRSVILTTNALERMRIDSTGDIRMGSNSGPAKFLFFGTSFWMKFPNSQYIFRHSNSQEGLYFNQPSQRIEYRDQVSVPNMWVQWASTGNAYFRGNVGLGTESPAAKLHLSSTVAGEIAKFNGGANSTYMGLYENGAYRGYIGSYSGNNEDVDFGTGGGTTGKLHLTIQASPRLTIDNTGRVGIGTTAPEANLHVFRGSAGNVTANANAPFVVENSTSNYINLITPDANERGILFGDNLNVQDGGILYTGSNQLHLRANGNINRMIIDPDGNTGINLDPINSGLNAAMLQVKNDGDDNIRLVANDNANDWSMFSADGTTGDLFLYKNGTFKGYFDAETGLYSNSDRRFKKDIADLPDIMENIMKLQPKKYHYTESANSEKFSYGFIAQEVNEIFPEFVGAFKDRKSGEERLALNYDNFGVIAIKAIQEQQKQINELKAMVQQLSAAVNAETNTALSLGKTVITPATLEQNRPNPFSQYTVVNYKIPAGAKAQINVYDAAGNLVKTLQASAGGQTQIHASDLKSGTYSYVLSVNGKTVASKKMIIAK